MEAKQQVKTTNKKAVSLIVLVITIIVMIILAATIILTLNNNGIIEQASDTVEVSNFKQIEHVASLGWADAYALGARDVDTLKASVDKALETLDVNLDKYEIIVTTSGVTVKLKETTTPDEGETGDGTEGGQEEEVLTQLIAPDIALNEHSLTITDNELNGDYTTNFEVYVDDEKVATITSSTTTTVDLAALNLEFGIYNITVKAVAQEGSEIASSEVSKTIEYTVLGEWVTAIVNGVPIPKGFVASSVPEESTKDGGFVIYEGTTPVTTLNVGTAKKEINQYVWVPVPKNEFKDKFIRQKFGQTMTLLNSLGGTFGQYWEVILDEQTNMPLATQDENFITDKTLAEVQAMYESVKTYGGFYIARYEAGLQNQRTSITTTLSKGTNVYSVMGKIPYTYIPWTKDNAMSKDTGGIPEVARSIYPESNTALGVVSTLTYGVQWDRTLAWWLEVKAKDGNGQIVTSVTTNGPSYGNFQFNTISSGDLDSEAQFATISGTALSTYRPVGNNTLGDTRALSTGALKAAKINNIYDMAGNMWELTMEGCTNSARVARGGGFTDYSFSVASRAFIGYNNDNFDYSEGFRVSLYIKK